MKTRRRVLRQHRTGILAGLLAVLVYLPGFWWGAPRAVGPDHIQSWGIDDEAPLGPLAQVHNIVEPKEFQNLGYPLMHSFMTAGVYAPYLAYLWIKKDFRDPSGSYPYGLAHPVSTLQRLTWLAHLLSVILGAGVVVMVYAAGRTLWDERTGALAAIVALVSYPMFYYARTANVDMAALFFITAALAVYARILSHGVSVPRSAWLGVCVGLAAATKEPSAASFLAIPFVFFAINGRACRWDVRSWSFWKAPTVALAGTVVSFGLGSGLFVDPGRYIAHVRFVNERIGAVREGVAFLTLYPNTLEGHFNLAVAMAGQLAGAMTLPGLVLAVAGIAWCLARRSPAALMVLPILTYLAVLFLSARTVQLRYVLPASAPLVLFTARAITAVESRPFKGKGWRLAAAVAAAWIIGLGTLRGATLTYEMIRDSRYQATRWLEAATATRPGATLEFFGPYSTLPWMPERVRLARAAPYPSSLEYPLVDQQAADGIIEGWRDRRPDFILILPDLTSPSGQPHSGWCPPAVYQGLLEGRYGYRLAATFHTPDPLPWLRRPVVGYGTVNPPIRIFTRRDVGPSEPEAS